MQKDLFSLSARHSIQKIDLKKFVRSFKNTAPGVILKKLYSFVVLIRNNDNLGESYIIPDNSEYPTFFTNKN
jgi:hypothetical protein